METPDLKLPHAKITGLILGCYYNLRNDRYGPSSEAGLCAELQKLIRACKLQAVMAETGSALIVNQLVLVVVKNVPEMTPEIFEAAIQARYRGHYRVGLLLNFGGPGPFHRRIPIPAELRPE